MLAFARRLDPGRRADLGGRIPGWAVLDVETPPSTGPRRSDARRRPSGSTPICPAAGVTRQPPPVTPFYLRASGAERERAILCLTQAIYYEAALEPTLGQEAVAQTVLNRVRHPNFPHSVCGVVYQGAQQATGCQFSFTCDGSRGRGRRSRRSGRGPRRWRSRR